MKKIVGIIALLLLCVGAKAQMPQRVPAIRDLLEYVQPNGDTLRVYLRGDEHKSWRMTEDGWQITENKRGWWVYCKKNRKGEAVTTRRKAHNAEQRTKCEIKWLEKRGLKKA